MEDFLYNTYSYFADGSLLEDLYQETLLTPLFFTMLAICAAVAFLFYVWPNKVSFTGFGHWLLMGLLAGLAVLVVTLLTLIQKADQSLARDEADPTQGFRFDQGSGVFFGFSVEMLLVAFLLFFLVSMAMKGFSRNAKHRPMLWPNK